MNSNNNTHAAHAAAMAAAAAATATAKASAAKAAAAAKAANTAAAKAAKADNTPAPVGTGAHAVQSAAKAAAKAAADTAKTAAAKAKADKAKAKAANGVFKPAAESAYLSNSGFTALIRGRLEEDKGLTSKALVEHGIPTVDARAFMASYHANMVVFAKAAVDVYASNINGTPAPAAAVDSVIDGARKLFAMFAANKSERAACLFDKAAKESNAAAARRISFAVVPLVINGTAKDSTAARRGVINVTKDGARVTAPAEKAVLQFCLDRLDGIRAMDATARIDDKAVKAAKAKAAKEAKPAK